MSAKWLGVFCLCPEQCGAGRKGKFATSLSPPTFVGELISTSSNSRTADREGDSLERVS